MEILDAPRVTLEVTVIDTPIIGKSARSTAMEQVARRCFQRATATTNLWGLALNAEGISDLQIYRDQRNV